MNKKKVQKSILIVLMSFLFFSCEKEKRYEEKKIMFGTYIQIIIYDTSKSHAELAMKKAFDEIERIDKKFNSKTEGSVFYKFNNSEEQEIILDDEGMFLMNKVQEIYNLSHKKYDITIYPLLEVWGFDKDEELKKVPTKLEIDEAKKNIGFEKLLFENKNNKIIKIGKIKELDTGSFLKGYALLKAKEKLKEENIKSAFISSISSIATIGTKPNNEPWKVGLQNPNDANEILGVIELSDEDMGVSGDYQTYVEVDGKKYHHILDKNTGYPVSDKKMVVVVGKNSFEEDLLSTAFFLMDSDEVIKYSEENNLKVLIIDKLNKEMKSKSFTYK